MKKLISNCILKKFQQFEEKIKGKKIELLNKAYNNPLEEYNNENKDKDYSSNLTKRNDNNDNNEDDLPPPEDALKYPDKNQVEEKEPTPKTIHKKSSDLKSISQNKIFAPTG